MDHINIQIKFTIEQDGIVFKDAINLTQAEYDAITPEQIEAIKQARFANHKTVIETTSKREPTKAELLENIAELDRQKAEYQSKIAIIDGK